MGAIMKGRHAHRVERVVRFDPKTVESETDFVVDWEETDPELEDMDARETALLAYGTCAHDD
jgi:hypothetical protein